MKKTYCDMCGEELVDDLILDPEEHTDIKMQATCPPRSIHTVTVVVTVPPDFDVCRYCVLKSINNRLDKRPRCASPEEA